MESASVKRAVCTYYVWVKDYESDCSFTLNVEASEAPVEPEAPDSLNVSLKDGAALIYGDTNYGYWDEYWDDEAEESFEYFQFHSSSIANLLEVYAVYDGDEVPLDSGDVSVQYDCTNWEAGSSYEVTVEYLGVTATVEIPVIENPVTAISFEPANPYQRIENIDGSMEDGYFYYSSPWFKDGDKLTLTRGGVDVEFIYFDVDDAFLSADGEVLSADFSWGSDQSEDNPWGMGSHEFVLTYMGQTCSVPVEVVANTVTAISFTPANPYQLIEGVDGYKDSYWNAYDEEVSFFRYDLPDFRTGDKLTVTDNGEQTEYSYDSEKWEFISADGVTISEGDCRWSSDQSWANPWSVGEHEYVITYRNQSCSVPVEVIANPVAAIAFTPVDGDSIELVENVGGEIEEDDDGEEFFHYNMDFQTGDKLTITGTDGTVTDYIYRTDSQRDWFVSTDDLQRIDPNDLWVSSNQYDEHWVAGGKYTVVLKYMAHECEISYVVKENPVTAISFETVDGQPYVLIEGVSSGTTAYDEEYEEYFQYDAPAFQNGDKLTVSTKAGETIEYCFNAETSAFEAEGVTSIPANKVKRITDQFSEHWTAGNTYTFTISYLGKIAEAQVGMVADESIDISGATIAVAEGAYVYTGEAIEPAVTVAVDGAAVPAEAYDVAYANNINAGTASVTVTAKDKSGYTGTASTTFTIQKAKVEAPTAKTGLVYTGEMQVGVAAAKFYDVADGSALGAGSYTATVTLKSADNCEWVDGGTDAKTLEWSIAPASLKDSALVLAKTSFTFNNKVQKPAEKTVGGKSLKAGTDYTVSYSNANSKNAGSYTVTVTGKGNYTGTSAKATYKTAKAKNPLVAKAKSKNAVTVKVGKSLGAKKLYKVSKN